MSAADAMAGHGLHGFADFFDSQGFRGAGGGQGSPAHPAQDPADIGLEENNDNEQEAFHDAVQEPFQGEKFQTAGRQIDERREEQARQDLNGLGALEKEEDLVNDNGDQDDVRGVLPA